MKTGIQLIAEERERQISQEGWTFDHDDWHRKDELALAAACYALPHHKRECYLTSPPKPILWPWGSNWWKPSNDRIRELTKAGALIAAEIDRLQRLENAN